MLKTLSTRFRRILSPGERIYRRHGQEHPGYPVTTCVVAGAHDDDEDEMTDSLQSMKEMYASIGIDEHLPPLEESASEMEYRMFQEYLLREQQMLNSLLANMQS